MSDSAEKTEEATPKRKKEMREKGELSTSQDFAAWLGVGAAAFALTGAVSAGTDAGVEQLLFVDVAAGAPDGDVAMMALVRGAESILGTVGMAACGAAILILIVAKKRRKNAA